MEIKTILKENGSFSSFLAYARLFKSKSYLTKFIWFFLMVSSTGISSYFFIEAVQSYFSREVITNINIINDESLKFPSVTFYFHENSSVKLPVKDFILTCNFFIYDCINEIETVIDKFGFVSYHFKTNRIFLPGETFGLKIRLKSNLISSDESILSGIRIIIHEDDQDPQFYGGNSLNGIDISPGFFHNVQIKKVVSQRLGEPYNNCLKETKSISAYDSKLYKYIFSQTNYSYTKADCFSYCFGTDILNYFNITNMIDHYNNAFMYVYQKTQLELKFLIKLYISSNFTYEFCNNQCPIECDSVSYVVTNSLTRISYFNEFKRINLTKDDVIVFNVYFADTQYTKISQIPKMEPFDLVSCIGGIIGAFMGISFLCIGELFETIIEIIFSSTKNDVENNSFLK